MEFIDATSAAQTAAECADIACLAARAAAELSIRGYATRQPSTESDESSFHGPSNEGIGTSTSSKLIAKHVWHSGKMKDVSPRGSVRLKSMTQCWQSNEMEWSGAAESRYDGHGSIRSSSMSMSSHSSVISTNEETAVSNIQNLDGFSRGDSNEASERIAKTRVSWESYDRLPVRFDELEVLTSDSEEENCESRGKTLSFSSSHSQNVSARSSSSARMGHDLAEIALREKEKAEEVRRNTWSHTSSDAELNGDNSWKRYGAGYTPASQGSRRHVKCPRESNDLDMESSYSSMSEEEQDLHSSRTPSAKESEMNNDMASQSPATTKSFEFSNYPGDGNRSTLNFGRLTGGRKNKASSHQPYTRVHSADASFTSKSGAVDEPLSISQKQTFFLSDKRTESLCARSQGSFNQTSPVKINKGSSATSHTALDLDGDNANEFHPCQNVGSIGYRGVMLSRRSRDSSSQSNTGVTPEVPDSSVFGARSRLFQENSYSSGVESLQAVNSGSRMNSPSFRTNSLVEQPSEPHPQIKISACKESSKRAPSNFAGENRSKTLPKTVVLGSSESSNPLGVSGNSTSGENSLKKPSHVHPKLPDYDTLVAQMKALRSNRRSL